ncbi:hypothetical protein Pmani_024280 [Petrolisthes manimaculis]|uniref:Uncharacterized protein n=1 Tax=Petrolisthes manimaculis TaxID=1843537 RepID=A0AAE1PAF6_9EUCA|nr:hypothetical protein Pmani_024280 [Petrolisthes manimaculis]
MVPPEAVNSTPAGQTPKSLTQQAARCLANQLVGITLPILDKYWKREIKTIETVMDTKQRDTNDGTLIKHVQSVHQWYHKDKYLCSHIRQLVGMACTEVLSSYLIYRNCELLVLFTIQLMFCQEAGYLGHSSKVYYTQVSRSYGEFLQLLVPFHIESLHTTSIDFQYPGPVIVLIKNSPCLREVHLNKNLSDLVLTHLWKYCPRLESVMLHGRCLVSEEFLFRMFFAGKGRKQVESSIDEKEIVSLSFPKLKNVKMQQDLHNDDILFYIQYFYTSVKTHWTKIIKETRLTPYLLKTLLGPPCCLEGKGNFEVDSLKLFIPEDSLDDWTTGKPLLLFPVVRKVDLCIRFTHKPVNLTELSEKICDLVERLQCTSLSHSSRTLNILNEGNINMPVLKKCWIPFVELHIRESTNLDVRDLFTTLNMCPNLKSLSINDVSMDMSTDQLVGLSTDQIQLVGLNTLSNLNSLSVHIWNSCTSVVPCLTHILRASPNLKVLELVGISLKTVVQDLAIFGTLDKIKVFSLCDTSLLCTDEDLHYFVLLGEILPSLKVLMLISSSLSKEMSRTIFHVMSHFANTQLKIIQRNKPYVG